MTIEALNNKALALWKRNKTKEAFALYLSAAKRGDPMAQYHVGYYFYNDGVGVRRSRRKAFHWLEKAFSGRKDGDIAWAISCLYAEQGSKRLANVWRKKALTLFENVAAQGDPRAALYFAQHLVWPMDKEARRKATVFLRKVISASRASREDKKEAKKVLIGIQCARLAEKAYELERKGSLQVAASFYTKLAESGVSTAASSLGDIYSRAGWRGRNLEKALYWYKRAGSSSCVAEIYAELGLRGQAMRWWKKSIAGGNGSSALDLAKFLMKDTHGAHRLKIFSLLRKAADAPGRWGISWDEKHEAARLLKTMQASMTSPRRTKPC